MAGIAWLPGRLREQRGVPEPMLKNGAIEIVHEWIYINGYGTR